MIYGATGYTGRMAAEHATAGGLHPIVAGRGTARLAPLAAELGCDIEPSVSKTLPRSKCGLG